MDDLPGQDVLVCSETIGCEGKGVVRSWIVLPAGYDVRIFQKLFFCICYWDKMWKGRQEWIVFKNTELFDQELSAFQCSLRAEWRYPILSADPDFCWCHISSLKGFSD